MDTPDSLLTDLLTTTEAANLLELHPVTLKQYRVDNTGPAYKKIGRKIRYRRADLEAWITTRWPRYSFPPHLTLNPWTGELRQHVAFNLAAYAIRSSRVDKMRFVYQVEHWGKAKVVPFYPDVWYQNVAKLIQWFHVNLGVPVVFDDFTNLRYGPLGSRLPYDAVDAFAGIIGHGRVGRGIDTHWDPGALDVPRLEAMLDTVTPPPPPPRMDVNMAYADTLNLDDWVATLRDKDIDQLFALGVHTGDAGFWKVLLARHPTAGDAGSWEGFRRTTSARIGFWQPDN